MFDAAAQAALQKYNGWRAEIPLADSRCDSEQFIEDEGFEDIQSLKPTIVGDET